MLKIDAIGRFNICVLTKPIDSPSAATILANLIDILDPLSKELFVLTGEFPDRPNEKARIIRIKSKSNRRSILSRVIGYLSAQLKITSNLIRVSKHIDIVIFFIGSGIYLLPVLTARLLRKKIVIVAIGLASKTAEKVVSGDSKRLFNIGRNMLVFTFKSLESAGFYLADQVAVENKSAVHFLELNKYSRKISINGAMYMDTDSFKIENNLETRRSFVGYVGRLEFEKGIINFARSIPLLLPLRDDLEFLIAGGGPLSDVINNELREAGVYSKVRTAGWIPHDELPRYLNELKLLVLPSYSEGLPAIVQEGMACGTVVLATPVGGVPDLIKDGETGFIMENNSPESIARNVVRALDHPNLEQIVQNARKLIEQEYTYEIMVEKFRQALERLEEREKQNGLTD